MCGRIPGGSLRQSVDEPWDFLVWSHSLHLGAGYCMASADTVGLLFACHKIVNLVVDQPR